jgi:hypothetical protein
MILNRGKSIPAIKAATAKSGSVKQALDSDNVQVSQI